MSKTDLPVYEAKPLIEIPEFIPQVGFLGGEQGKEINKEIQTKYKGFDVLQIASYKQGVIKGSNPFYVVAVNEILRQDGLITASPADLEKVLKTGALDLRGQYEDSALVLRNQDNPNSYLAKDLIKQVKARGRKKMPVMIPLNGLELRTDQNSPHGLSFNLTDKSEIIYASVLNKDGGNFNSEDINEKTGLPEKLGRGNRTFYTRDSGLSRVSLDDNLDLYSNWDNLGDSGDAGRVVLLSGEATSQKNLQDKLLNQINTSYQTKIEELNSKRAEAEKAIQDIMGRKH